MSQQRAEHNNNDVINVDDDEEDEDVQLAGIVRPPTTTIDLCLSPSTSAAAAAASRSLTGDVTGTAAGTSARAAAVDSYQDPLSTAFTTPPAVVSAPTTPEAGKSVNVEAATNTSGENSSLQSPAAGALECPICLQTCIHPARLPCGHIFCFLCVKGVAYKNRRCAMCRREIPSEFLDHPQLVNGIEDICVTRATEDGYQWYYEGRNGGWWAYDPRTNEDIEIAYAGYLRYKAAKSPLIAEDHNLTNPFRAPPPELTEPGVTEPMAPISGAAPSNAAPPSIPESSITLYADDFEEETIEMEDEDRDSIFGDDALDYDASAEEGWQSSASDDLSEIGPHAGRLHQQICAEIYVIDFLKMKQYPRSSPDRRRNILRCKTTDTVPGITKGWWQYDDRTSQDIEEAFKKGDKSCTILVAGYVYIVDLEQLVQQRQNEPTRCRRVKRDLATIPKKGVAGLRIEGNQVTSDTVFSRPTSTASPATVAAAASSFISTIAATDAAIRIASDIIGSTLAHADELTRGLAASNIIDDPSSSSSSSGEQTNSTNPQIAGRSPASSPSSSSIQDLITQDLRNTQQVIAHNQHTIDLFEQALNDFQALTMRNYVDSSDEEDENGAQDREQEQEQLETGEQPKSADKHKRF